MRTLALAQHRRRAALIGAAGAAAIALGMVLPHPAPDAPGTLPFTLVQPDVRQEELNDPRQWESQFIKTARLSLAKPVQAGAPRLVLWPELGVPDYLRPGYPRYLYEETTFAADPVAGAPAHRARDRRGWPASDRRGRSGSARAGSGGGAQCHHRDRWRGRDFRGSYAKAHLVPYGEYLPLRWLLEPLGASRLVAGSLDFWPGPGPRTVDLGRWGKAGMQICYEIVFSGEVVDRRHRPDYLFNPSNDGWFGSWGPPQHLAQARLRAVEEGLPVLRATTTGISAVIDADGVVRQHVPRHTAARLDGTIPPAHAPTLFARMGNALPLVWAAFLLVLSLVALRRGRH